jgi:cupin fold WbuC family metalloprotein
LRDATQLIQLAENVFVRRGTFVRTNSDDVALICRIATRHANGVCRINYHPTYRDSVQEMLIALTGAGTKRPHVHRSASESFNLLQGTMGVALFSDSGDLQDVVGLDASGPASRYYRLSPGIAHMPVCIGDIVVFHETATGPFIQGNNYETPGWALEMTDEDWRSLISVVQNY